MVSVTHVDDLKSLVRQRISAFVRARKSTWKAPLLDTFNILREAQLSGVIFGGTIRSLLLGRRGERPRDVDLVFQDATCEQLRDLIPSTNLRQNRFGGLHLERDTVHFDLWPVAQTYAFKTESIPVRDFGRLPATTFLDIEAVAIDLWPAPGRARRIYTFRDSFFRAIQSRTIEINNEENPFPTLCVVRSLIIAQSIGFAVGPRLAQYITDHGLRAEQGELSSVQFKHYGKMRWSETALREWIDHIHEEHCRHRKVSIALPPWQWKQLEFGNTPEANDNPFRCRLYAI